MSVQYDDYLAQHKANVARAYEWLEENLPHLVDIDGSNVKYQTAFSHDASKSQPDEYEPYDRYFYGNNRSYQVVQDYNKAWLLHLHRNSHHWQYWVLINDDPENGEIVLDMPYDDILEMICDWWSFSWKEGDLYKIFEWYDERKQYIKLSKSTRARVEAILQEIRKKLDELNGTGGGELQHHGVKGQKWGVKNGPPYPLETDKKSDKISTVIPKEKFTEYALNPSKNPDKANAFKEALGYDIHNYQDLSDDIEAHANKDKMEQKGDNGYGMRYQQIMRLTGPNGKQANVLTAWIEREGSMHLTSAYITKKGASE